MNLLAFKCFECTFNVFRNDFDKKVDLASLMVEINDEEDINNPNNVKVVTEEKKAKTTKKSTKKEVGEK